MQVTISNEIFITPPTPEIVSWARENLVIPNPEYSKKQRMGLWTGNTEKQLYLYYVDGEALVLPCGAGKQIRPLISGADIRLDVADNGRLEFHGTVPLYDYQDVAVRAMLVAGCGILQSFPAEPDRRKPAQCDDTMEHDWKQAGAVRGQDPGNSNYRSAQDADHHERKW